MLSEGAPMRFDLKLSKVNQVLQKQSERDESSTNTGSTAYIRKKMRSSRALLMTQVLTLCKRTELSFILDSTRFWNITNRSQNCARVR